LGHPLRHDLAYLDLSQETIGVAFTNQHDSTRFLMLYLASQDGAHL
jgi:hypothetical protein